MDDLKLTLSTLHYLFCHEIYLRLKVWIISHGPLLFKKCNTIKALYNEKWITKPSNWLLLF